MKHDAAHISVLTARNLELAKSKLAELEIYCGHEPNFAALHGWVYEQTIQFCLNEELAEHGLRPETEEQVRFTGRAKADFRLDHILIEVKTSGLFGVNDVQKYGRYMKEAESKGYRYLFVTAYETHEPYRRGIIDKLGHKNVFILAHSGEWKRLVETLVEELTMRPRDSDGGRGR